MKTSAAIKKFITGLSKDFRRVPDKQESLVLLMLTVLGLLGNRYNVELFFGMNFIFGSIASLLAVQMSGVLWGTLVGCAVASYSWVLWFHPYAMIVFTLEIFFAGCFRPHQKDRLVLSVIWYWILIGPPLLWFFYTYFLGFSPLPLQLVILKQVVNGVFNAVIARIIIQILPRRKWCQVFFRNAGSGRWSLESAISLTLAMSVLIPMLSVMVVTNQNRLEEIRSEIQTLAVTKAQDVHSQIYSKIQIYSSILGSVVSAELPSKELAIPTRHFILPLMDKSVHNIIPGLQDLKIAEKDGTVLYDYGHGNHDRKTDSELISVALQEGFAISDIQNDSPAEPVHFSLAAPLPENDLFMILTLRQDLFRAELEDIYRKKQMFIEIRDSRKRLVAQTPETLSPDAFIPRPKDPNILVPKVSTAAMIRWANSYWIHKVPFSPMNRWTVTVMLPLRESITSLQMDYVRQLTVMSVISVIALLLSSLAARMLGRPIVQLTEVAVKFTESTSRQDISWPVSSINEISILVQQFRKLLETEKQKQMELELMTDELEQRVERRTDQLRVSLAETEKAREWIDGILKSVAEGILVTDLHNRVTLMNPAAEKWLVCRPGAMLDSCDEIDVLEETLRNKIRKAIERDMTIYEFDFESGTGEGNGIRIMQGCTSVIYNKNGKATGTVTAFHDVTREREADRIKSEFLSTAAHELRTPLTSIQGFSEILLTRDNLKQEEKARFLSHINRQAVKLGNLVNDLLDLSRIESGKGFIMQFGNHIMEDLIPELLSCYQGISKKHEVTFKLPEIRTELRMDRDKISQVLHNLLSNSLKFSPNGGTIHVKGYIYENRYFICVQDQGIGMTAEQMTKMFDKFYRADASNSAPEGTGLGMSIVKHIVEAHGGEVKVESELGQGTTVCFSLPVRKFDEDVQRREI